MSNVKVNGNTYNDIHTLRLMKSDNSGYATYTEGAVETDTLFDKLVSGESIGDYECDLATPILNWMAHITAGTVSLPYATSGYACVQYSKFDNFLMPNATKLESLLGPGTKSYMLSSKFEGCNVTGVLDLSSLETVMNNTVTFRYSNIGTLKLGSYKGIASNLLANVTISNLVWNMPAGISDTDLKLYFGTGTFTNVYIPSERVSEVQALIDNGDITKITNLYSIEDWEE